MCRRRSDRSSAGSSLTLPSSSARQPRQPHPIPFPCSSRPPRGCWPRSSGGFWFPPRRDGTPKGGAGMTRRPGRSSWRHHGRPLLRAGRDPARTITTAELTAGNPHRGSTPKPTKPWDTAVEVLRHNRGHCGQGAVRPLTNTRWRTTNHGSQRPRSTVSSNLPPGVPASDEPEPYC